MNEILRLIKGEVCMGTYGLVELELRKLVEENGNSLQQLKAEIAALADKIDKWYIPASYNDEKMDVLTIMQQLSAV